MITALGLILGFLGCQGISSGFYPVYAKPELPPMNWVECKAGMQCLPNGEYTGLREYAIIMDGIVDKYENQTKIINGERTLWKIKK